MDRGKKASDVEGAVVAAGVVAAAEGMIKRLLCYNVQVRASFASSLEAIGQTVCSTCFVGNNSNYCVRGDAKKAISPHRLTHSAGILFAVNCGAEEDATSIFVSVCVRSTTTRHLVTSKRRPKHIYACSRFLTATSISDCEFQFFKYSRTR